MNQILDVIGRELKTNPAELSFDTKLADLRHWDSLKHMDLIAALEDTLAIEFTGDEIAEMVTVDAIVNISKAHMADKD